MLDKVYGVPFRVDQQYDITGALGKGSYGVVAYVLNAYCEFN